MNFKELVIGAQYLIDHFDWVVKQLSYGDDTTREGFLFLREMGLIR